MAVAAGLIATLAGVLTQSGWGGLAVTLRVSYRLLSLYESDARVDYDELSLGVGDFTAYIDKSCSGYEGMGLVTAFLSLFLWVFRRSLLFQCARSDTDRSRRDLVAQLGAIAALVSLGAHVSPEVAISGFHSQSGMVAFLFVAIGIMAAAPRLAVFGTNRENITDYWSPNDRLILAFLAPFMSLDGGKSNSGRICPLRRLATDSRSPLSASVFGYSATFTLVSWPRSSLLRSLVAASSAPFGS